MKLEKMMEAAGRFTIRRAVPILIGVTLITVISLIGASRLGVDTDIANMLPSDNPVARSFTEISKDFETTSTLITVIEGPDRLSLIQAAEDFSARIQSDPRTEKLVRSVRLKVDRDFAEKWGLMLQDQEELDDTERLFASTRLLPLLRETNNLLEEKLSDGSNEEVEGSEGEDSTYDLMSRIELFGASLQEALQNPESSYGDRLADDWMFGEGYFIDPEGKTLILIVRPSFSLGDRASLSALSSGAAEIGKEIAGSGNPGIVFSFTGDVENEAQEETAIGSDVLYPSIIAMVLIIVLFLFSFNKKRSIFFALLALTVGIIIDLGFAAMTVHKLNMITSSFGALLVGLGIDFGIHIASRYDDAIGAGWNSETAMGHIFSTIGGPIIIGGLTTSLAFYSLMLSKTIAFRQFGLVAGTGILTTLAAAFIVLPALLAVFPGSQGKKRSIKTLDYSLPLKAARFSQAHRRIVIASFVVLTLVALVGIRNVSFEYDMRKIGPQHTTAQSTERIVAERFGISTWQNLASASSVEEARELHNRFKSAAFVRRVESIADYLPEASEQTARLEKISAIGSQKARSAGAPWTEADTREFSDEIQRMEWNMIELGDLAAASLGERSLPVRKRNAMIREIFGQETGTSGKEVFRQVMETIERLGPTLATARLDQLDSEFSSALDRKISRLASVNRPMLLTDIPPDIRGDLVNEDGTRYLVVIQGAADMAGNTDFMQFTDGLAAVDSGTTGSLSLGLALSREIIGESSSSGVIVALIVLIIIGIGFRSFKLTLITGLAFLSAFIGMFGLYSSIGTFNIVNALSLPLIVGVGIDYCVHMVSAFQEKKNAAASLKMTVKAVTLSALTTMIGFGSLALVGKFKGIADLGTTLFIGIAFCYLVAIVLIPACIGPVNNTTGEN